jgi:hypothetical protein
VLGAEDGGDGFVDPVPDDPDDPDPDPDPDPGLPPPPDFWLHAGKATKSISNPVMQ